jgi:hypothetical protein
MEQPKKNEEFTLIYGIIENGQRTLKIGKMLFDNKGQAMIIVEVLDAAPGGAKICYPLPNQAALQKLTTGEYFWPDVFIMPKPRPGDSKIGLN